MLIQSLLIATVMNYKRLGALYRLILPMKQQFEGIFKVIWRDLSEAKRKILTQILANTFTPTIPENRG